MKRFLPLLAVLGFFLCGNAEASIFHHKAKAAITAQAPQIVVIVVTDPQAAVAILKSLGVNPASVVMAGAPAAPPKPAQNWESYQKGATSAQNWESWSGKH